MLARFRWSSLSFAVLVLLALSSRNEASADLFYSIDMATDELVTMDSGTGQVNVVGSLGVDFGNGDISMETYNGTLYSVFGDFDSRRADLYEINRYTGQATHLARLYESGVAVTLAEGMVATPSGLRVAYTTSSSSSLTSPLIGNMALDGNVTNGVDSGIDLDGIALPSTGRLFGYNARSTSVQYFNLEPTELIGNHSANGTQPLDVDFVDGSIWGISEAGIVEISPVNGSLLGFRSLIRSGNYSGFTAVPEPSTYLLWAIALGGVAWSTRRRFQKRVQ